MAETEEIIVEGMTCANCARGVQKGLEKAGLEDVNVDFASGEVIFKNTPKLSREKISQEVSSIGYSVKQESTEGQSKKGFLKSIEAKFYFSLIFTIPLLAHMFIPVHFLMNPWFQLSMSLPVVILGFVYFGKSAFFSLRNGVPNMDVLIFIGSMSAFAYSLAGTLMHIGTEEVYNFLFYETAATIITLVLLGNLLEHKSVKQTTSAIADLNKLQVEKAQRVVQGEGEERLEEVSIEDIRISDILQINSGDRIPTDGKVHEGEVYVNESMLTGEAESVRKQKGAKVFGGTLVEEGNIRLLVTAVGKDTTLSKIVKMVKQAQADKPDIQRLGDKVSAIFVPVVVGIAVLTFAIWYFVLDSAMEASLMNAIAVLVISCPCAMGLATPTAVMVGVGRAARQGILIKGGATVELFARLKNIVFDKTGTLTKGDFELQKIDPLHPDFEESTVLNLLYSMEQYSSHPLAKSLIQSLKAKGAKNMPLMDQKEIKGKGIEAKDLEGNTYQLGSASWLGSAGLAQMYLSKNQELLAAVFMQDTIREDASEMIASFQKTGVKTIMLSGDRKEKVEEVAQLTGIAEYYAEQLPDQKLELIGKKQSEGLTAMVGDGINDAPALSKADVGISLSNSTQIAIQSAQVVLLNAKSLKNVYKAFQLSKHTLLTIKQNLFWAFFYNVIAIPLAAMGYLDPMIAAFSMAFSDVIVIGNSIRLRYKKID